MHTRDEQTAAATLSEEANGLIGPVSQQIIWLIEPAARLLGLKTSPTQPGSAAAPPVPQPPEPPDAH